MINKTLFIAASLACSQLTSLGAYAASDPAASLAVEVANIRGTQGRLVMALYDTPKTYNKLDEGAAYAAIAIRPKGDKTRIRFDTLAPGRYALVLFHDKNNNGKFDFDGDMPLEGYGTSGASHSLDEPDFKKASVEVKSGAQAISVKLHYFKN